MTITLNYVLDRIYSWVHANKLARNIDKKPHCMPFAKKIKNPMMLCGVKIINKFIKAVESYKFLVMFVLFKLN